MDILTINQTDEKGFGKPNDTKQLKALGFVKHIYEIKEYPSLIVIDTNGNPVCNGRDLRVTGPHFIEPEKDRVYILADTPEKDCPKCGFEYDSATHRQECIDSDTPAMKEVETVEQAAERLNEEMAPWSTTNWKQGFIAGAQWREENPVMGEVNAKTAEQVLLEIATGASLFRSDNSNAKALNYLVLKEDAIKAMETYRALPPTPKQDKDAYLTQEIVEQLGFKPVPHYTVMNSLTFDVGRNRHLSIGCVGTPNEMLWLCNVEKKSYTDLICLHNFDYDGKLTVSKLQQFINVFNHPNTQSTN